MTAQATDALDSLVRRTDPADPGAQNNLGVALLARGDRDRAAAAFSRALALDPRMTLARRNLDAVDGPARRSQRIEALRGRLRVDAGDVAARRELAEQLVDAGDVHAARRELDALARRAPDDLATFVHGALCEERLGDLDAAEARLCAALALGPDTVVPRLLLGELHYKRGQPERAIVVLDEACALAPDFAEAHYARGFVLGELGRIDEAHDARERAVALNTALGRSATNLVVAPTGQATRAPVSADDVPGLHEQTHLALGGAFRAKGLLQESIREYRRAVSDAASRAVATRALAELYLLTGELAAATAQWATLTAMCDDDASAWHGSAVTAHLCGDLETADAAYGRAAQRATRAPHVADAADVPGAAPHATALVAIANDHAVLWAARGDVAAAVERLRAVVSDHAPPNVVRLNYAQLLAVSGDTTGALAQYRAAVEGDPRDADAWAALGSSLARLGRGAEARVALSRALDVDPERADVRYELGFLAEGAGEHGTALRQAESGMARSAYVERRALRLAISLGGAALDERVFAAVDDRPFAAQALSDATIDALLGGALAPDRSLASARDAGGVVDRYAVARELLRAGMHQRAIGVASAALAQGADRVAGLVLLGDAFASQGYFGEALERYADARAADGTSRDARVGELRMLRETGRRDEALTAAEALVAALGEAACTADASELALCSLAHADAGDEATARGLLRRACALAARAGDWATIGAGWRALGDHRREAAAYATACRTGDADASLRLACARAWRAAGFDDEATTVLAALAADGDPSARLELAEVHTAAGNPASARSLLADLLSGDPTHVDALAALGALLCDERRYDDARRAVARALRLDRSHALALAVDGDLLASAGRVEQARGRWRQAVDLEPASIGGARARTALARQDAARRDECRQEAA